MYCTSTDWSFHLLLTRCACELRVMDLNDTWIDRATGKLFKTMISTYKAPFQYSNIYKRVLKLLFPYPALYIQDTCKEKPSLTDGSLFLPSK